MRSPDETNGPMLDGLKNPINVGDKVVRAGGITTTAGIRVWTVAAITPKRVKLVRGKYERTTVAPDTVAVVNSLLKPEED